MFRTRKSPFILAFAILALALTSCGGGETKIVYRDAPPVPEQTTTSTTAAAKQYFDYSETASLCSEVLRFCASFPVVNQTTATKVMSYDIDPTSTVTGGKRYYTTVVAATKGDKLIYCTTASKACSLYASFDVEVLPDNDVNRAAIHPDDFMNCTNRTFTGVAGQDCDWGAGDGIYRDAYVTYEGWIYHVSAHGPSVFGYSIFNGFFDSFGFKLKS